MTKAWDQPIFWCSICYRLQLSDRGKCLCGGALELAPPPPTTRELVVLLRMVSPRIGMSREVDPQGEFRDKLAKRCLAYAASLELDEDGRLK